MLGATVQSDDVQTVAAFDLAEGPIALVLIPRIALRGFYDLDPVRTGHLSGGLNAGATFETVGTSMIDGMMPIEEVTGSWALRAWRCVRAQRARPMRRRRDSVSELPRQ